MDTMTDTRMASFNVCTGKLTPSMVNVHIYKSSDLNEYPKVTIRCDPITQERYIFTKLAKNLPKNDLWYAYEIHLHEKQYPGPYRLTGGHYDSVSQNTKWTEIERRSLPSGTDLCQDILKVPELSVEDNEQGLHFYLSDLFNVERYNDQNNLSRKLNELENLISVDILHIAQSSKMIKQLLIDIFQLYKRDGSQYEKLVLVCVFYGKVPKLKLDLVSVLNTTVKYIKTIKKSSLTEWALQGIKETCHRLLRERASYHWLYFATEFHNLFDLEEILVIRQNNNHDVIERKTLENMIPKIENNYSYESFELILQEVLNEFGMDRLDKETFSKLTEPGKPTSGIPYPSSSNSSGPISAPTEVLFCAPKPSTEEEEKQTFVFNPPAAISLSSHEEPASPDNTKTIIPFRVLVQYSQVSAVTLCIRKKNESDTKARDQVMVKTNVRHDFKDDWYFAEIDVELTHGCSYIYFYKLTSSDGAQSSDICERQQKVLAELTNVYDVFKHPCNKPKQVKNTNSQGILLFLDIVLSCVTTDNLQLSLKEAVATIFFKENIDTVKFIGWFQRRLSYVHRHHAQVIFMAVLLGKLIRLHNSVNKIPGKDCIYMANTLKNWGQDQIPQEMVQNVQSLCVWLINGFHGDWLHLWYYFFEILSADVLLELHKKVETPMFKITSLLEEKRLEMILQNADKVGKLIECVHLIQAVIRIISNMKVFKRVLGLLSKNSYTLLVNNDMVTDAAVTKLNDLLNNLGNFDRMVKTWTDVVGLKIPKLTDGGRRFVIRFLHNAKWSPSDMSDIENVILNKDLYKTSKDFRDVTNLIFDKHNGVHVLNVSTELLKRADLLPMLNDAELQLFIEKGITFSASFFDKPKQKTYIIFYIYTVLSIITQAEHMRNKPHLVKRIDFKVYSCIEKVTIEDMLQALGTNTTSDPEQVILSSMTDHIQRRLREERSDAKHCMKHCNVFRDNNGCLKVDNKNIVKILDCMIDIQKPTLHPSDFSQTRSPSIKKLESAILKLMRDLFFWLMVFKVSGKHKNKILQIPALDNVRSLLKYLETHVSQMSTTVGFLPNLEKHKKETAEIVELLLPQEHATRWEEKIKVLKEKEKLFRSYLNHLDTFSRLLVGHLSLVVEVTDKHILQGEISNRSINLNIEQSSVCDTTTPQYWGRLFPLIRELEPVGRLIPTKIFLNICRSLFDGTCPKCSEDKGTGEKDIPDICVLKDTLQIKLTEVNFTQLATLVSRSCLPIFRQQCKLLFGSNLEVPLDVISNLMAGVNSDELECELQIIIDFFEDGKTNTFIAPDMKLALAEYVNRHDLVEKSNLLEKLFIAFDSSRDDDLFKALATIQSVSLPELHEQMQTLRKLHEALQNIAYINERLEDGDWAVVEQLGKCRHLIRFLRPRIHEDMRYLTAVAVQRSNQYVNESTVSDFLDVKQYLSNFLSKQMNCRVIIDIIHPDRERANTNKIANKICNCVGNFHSLKDIYINVAEHIEATREIIFQALQHGKYKFYIVDTNEHCLVTLSYPRGTTNASYGTEDLNDLRSEASMLVTDENTGYQMNQTHQLTSDQIQEFIDAVGMVNKIIDLRNMLINNPWFTDTDNEQITCLKHLKNSHKKLQNTYDKWLRSLAEARRTYYYLTFFQSKHLKLIDDFFNGDSITKVNEDLKLLFQFVHSGVKVTKELRTNYDPPTDFSHLDLRLFAIGIALEKIFSTTDTIERPFFGEAQCYDNLQTKVRPGSVYVAELEKESTRSIPVLLSLYKSTCNVLPQASEVVFCHEGTSWEEIELLIQRSVGAYDKYSTYKLYTIVNLELLQADIQFKLVSKVKHLNDSESKKYLLALICRGGRYHHVVHQFPPNNTHRVSGLSDAEMTTCLQNGWPNVEVVTSSHAGLGKTNYIAAIVSEDNCGIISLHVSGPVTKEVLVKQFKDHLKSKQYVIHTDAASMSNASLFDSFIFEIVVIGMSCSGTQMCAAPTSRIFLEVANTPQDKLINSLTTCSAFRRKHLTWSGFSSFIVSTEINSPVQVVCHYLNALDTDTVNRAIQFTGQKTVDPLSAHECHLLMEKHIVLDVEMSYTSVGIFLAISAHALRNMSSSLYFSARNLKDMIGDEYKAVRRNLVTTVLEAATEFSARSVSRHLTGNAIGSNPAVAFVQHHSTSMVSANEMVARMRGMLTWSDTNHLLPVFHRSDSQTLSLLYRLLKHVPTSIKTLFENQLKRPLEDYHKLTQDELQRILERICRTTIQPPFDKKKLQELENNYVLTPDNFLKMVLIYIRIRCNIPVIIMGETGCGKTTLVTYLARVCEVYFSTLHIHSGIGNDDITAFVERLILEAEKNLEQDVWGFLDEINTCDYLGLLNELVCHKRWRGSDLPSNVKLIAACNPYRLRVNAATVIQEIADTFRDVKEWSIPISNEMFEQSIGLKKRKHKHDDYAKLVYRVHPLPETMMAYVWDYGSLGKQDELRYIKRMLDSTATQGCLFVHLVAMSQDFVRLSEETECIRRICTYYKKNSNSWFIQAQVIQKIPTSFKGFGHNVSLREVNRCKDLRKWFKDMLEKKGVAPVEGLMPVNDLEIRSMVLALGHCYHSRLTTKKERIKYRHRVALILSSHNTTTISENDIRNMICCEQMDLLNRMIPKPGYSSRVSKGTSVIAKNEALRENVFVILTSILNRIPIIVVGIPGSSKSLSMKLIESNLRGRDSSDEYFQQLPIVYVISYQGSESSTSEGIIKVFDSAKKYTGKHGVLPVVLLDEIELAEQSSSNPLKVLHSQLEPTVGGYPAVAVVGISNFQLDASKMNRAVHLSRPEPTIEDLSLTAKCIRHESAICKTGQPNTHVTLTDEKLDRLAAAYNQYQRNQVYVNFHGLRDYYYLVKYVALQAVPLGSDLGMIVEKGLLRNFGGLKQEMNEIMNTFSKKIEFEQQPDKRPTVLQLVDENVTDKHSRHLLLISFADSALSILEQSYLRFDFARNRTGLNPTLLGSKEQREKYSQPRNLEIILGSKFENDMSAEYNDRILRKIIFCMKQGVILLLKDLESIYSSLYDMLNQNYTVVGDGKARTCRVALGPYTNSMCNVHDNFRCIVLIDETNLNKQDPSFLNRFEKQRLCYTDLMNNYQLECISRLNEWMDSFKFNNHDNVLQMNPDNMFMGYHNETLPSLMYLHSKNNEPEDKNLMNLCKHDLMKLACPDGVLKLRKSVLARDNLGDVKMLVKEFFNLPLHTGLRDFLATHLENGIERDLPGQYLARCLKTIIYTHSTIYTDISDCIGERFRVQVSKLHSFQSEQSLSTEVNDFWFISDAEVLILQCMPSYDAPNMMLAKCIIDQFQTKYLKLNGNNKMHKHACIIVHLNRDATGTIDDVHKKTWHFNFQGGWQHFTIDCLERTSPFVTELIYGSSSEITGDFCLVSEILDRCIVSVEKIICDQMIWCFNCINYSEDFRSAESRIELSNRINTSTNLMRCLKLQILNYIRIHEKSHSCHTPGEEKSWQVQTACDADLMFRCPTMVGAMLHYIKRLVRKPLTKVIFFLEKSCAWPLSCTYTVQANMNPDEVAKYEEFWQMCFHSKAIFDIFSADLPDPRGPETCEISTYWHHFQFPFFKIFYSKIDSFCEWLLEDTSVYDRENEIDLEVYMNQLTDYVNGIPEMQYLNYLDTHWNDYRNDFCAVVSKDYTTHLDDLKRYKIMISLLEQVDPKLISTVNATEYISRLHLIMCCFKEQIISELQLIDLHAELAVQSIDSLMMDCLPGYLTKHNNVKEVSEHFPGDFLNTGPTLNRIDTSVDQSTAGVKDTEYETGQESANQESFAESTESLETLDAPEPMLSYKTKPFPTHLVTEVCKSILPFRETIVMFGGLDKWLRKVNLALLLAGRVSRDSSSLYFLRLCRDFTSVAMKYGVTADVVAKLANFAVSTDDQISNKSVFEFIYHQITLFRNVERDAERKSMLDEFLCRYFNLCLEDNLDTPLIPQMIEKLTNASGVLLAGSYSVLHSIITSDIKTSSFVWEEIIANGEFDSEQCPNLDTINKILQESKLDSSLAVACSDIIEDTYITDAVNVKTISSIESEDSNILKLVTEASRTVEQSTSCTLRFTFAVAYLRAFVHSVTELLRLSEPIQFKSKEKFFVLGSAVNGLLQLGKSFLPIYFLKSMRQNKNLLDLRKWCEELADPFNVLGTFTWQDSLQTSCLGYNPMSTVKHYREAITAIVGWQISETSDTTPIDELVLKTTTNPEYRLAMLAAVTELFYWTQTTVIGQTPSDKLKAKELNKQAEKFNPYFKLLLEKLLGLSNFTGVLTISEVTSMEQLQQMSVVIHLACLVASYNNATHTSTSVSFVDIIMPYATNVKYFLPGVGSTTSALRCSEQTCTGKYSNRTLPTLRIREMTPAAYRVLDLIIHGCYLVKLACGLYSEEDIRSAITSYFNAYPETPCIDYLYKRVKEDFRLLREIIISNDENVALFLHNAFQRVWPMLVNPDKTPQTEDDRDKFEEEFSKEIQYLVTNIPECQRKYKTMCLEAQNVSIDTLEGQLEELNDITSGENFKLRFFRKRYCPTFESFRARFISNGRYCEFPFLQLCLAYHELLKLLQYLPVLIQWNNLISTRLNLTIKRHQAKTTTIADFLENEKFHPNKSSQDSAKHLFTSFQDAWNSVNDKWRGLTKSESNFGMINHSKPLHVCIIDKVDTTSCPLQCMIIALQKLQNYFLTETLEIAKSGSCSNLNFMISNSDSATARLKSVPINSANSEFIRYSGSQNLLEFSDVHKRYQLSNVDTKYGYGGCIKYNLTVIERELAQLLVMHKALLNDGSAFTRFTYSDELFHACSVILVDIRIVIPQQTLGTDMANVLQTEQDRRSTFATDLLDYLEVILVLLKKTGGDPLLSLEEYIERWHTKLPGSFPEHIITESRGHTIQLQHIVDLYERVENLLMNDVTVTLGSPFREELPIGTTETLLENIKFLNLNDLVLVTDVIRRFVFRYVRTSIAENSHILRTSLIELIRRTVGTSIDSHILKQVARLTIEEVNLCHVVTILLIIDQQAKQLQDYDKKIQRQKLQHLDRVFCSSERQGRRRARSNLSVS